MKTKVTALLAGLLCLGMLVGPAAAEGPGLFRTRRTVGMLFLGGSAIMVKQGIDFRSEADDFYARYERATDREEIGRLYQRTNNRDIKSQLSWAMAAAFTVTGLRLILSPGPDSGPTPGSHLSALPKLPGGLELTSRVAPQRLAVGFRRSFF